jgi:hypothetical protein
MQGKVDKNTFFAYIIYIYYFIYILLYLINIFIII